MAAGAYLVVIHPYKNPAETLAERAYTWRGPLSYIVFHLAVLGGLVVAFVSGWGPWVR